MGKVVGIDLGTTNSVVAVIEGGRPVVITNAEGMRITPSVVAFSKDGERLVGQVARRQTVLNPQNTFYSIKRFMGQRYADLSPESKRVPYTIRRDETGAVRVRCPRLEKDFAPEEISSMILRKLADEAGRYLGQPVTGAVITVPAYFNDAQRQATRDAGRIAGLDVKRIINEPTAAALAYGFDRRQNQTILVFDLGGGTFDVSVLDVGDGVFEVRATSGDTQLGGNDFDRKLVDWLAAAFLAAEGIDLRRDRQALQRLTEAAEKAKIELSTVAVTDINLPFITATPDGPKHIETELTRSQFEDLCGDLLRRLELPVKQALADAGLNPNRIDEVILVGGASRMPMVVDLVRRLIGLEPVQDVNPDEAVAIGAAIQAGILTQEVEDILLLDVTPLSLGLETIGGVMKKLIPRNTTIPVRRSDVFSTGENNQTMVEIHVAQGEREMATDNKSLGRFKLMGIPPAPRGVPQILVSFDIDANGILQVSAMDKATGREQGITVQGASTLSEDEVQRMIAEAEEFAEDDRFQREQIEKRNRAEALTFQGERLLREVALDFGMQFASDRRRRIESLIRELREALGREDERGIDIAQGDLQDAMYDLRREAYYYDDAEDEGFFAAIRKTLTGDRDREPDYSGSSWDYFESTNPSYGRNRYNPDPYSRDVYNRDAYGRSSAPSDYRADTYGWERSERLGNDDRDRRSSPRDAYDPYAAPGDRSRAERDWTDRADRGRTDWSSRDRSSRRPEEDLPPPATARSERVAGEPRRGTMPEASARTGAERRDRRDEGDRERRSPSNEEGERRSRPTSPRDYPPATTRPAAERSARRIPGELDPYEDDPWAEPSRADVPVRRDRDRPVSTPGARPTGYYDNQDDWGDEDEDW